MKRLKKVKNAEDCILKEKITVLYDFLESLFRNIYWSGYEDGCRDTIKIIKDKEKEKKNE